MMLLTESIALNYNVKSPRVLADSGSAECILDRAYLNETAGILRIGFQFDCAGDGF